MVYGRTEAGGFSLVVDADGEGAGHVFRGKSPKPIDLSGTRPPYVLTEEEVDRDARGFSLWPLADFCPDLKEQRRGLFYFNALKGERIEQLSYELPALQRNPDMWDDFMAKLPYREWRQATVELFQGKR